MSEVCAVCLEDISENSYTIPECCHRFHLDCIILWWRSPREYHGTYGDCPICRQPANNPYRWVKAHGRVRLLKRLAKKKTVHPDLKKAAVRLKKADAEYKLAKKEHLDFRRIPHVKDIRSKDRILSNIKWSKLRKMGKRENELAAFDPIGALSESFLWE